MYGRWQSWVYVVSSEFCGKSKYWWISPDFIGKIFSTFLFKRKKWKEANIEWKGVRTILQTNFSDNYMMEIRTTFLKFASINCFTESLWWALFSHYLLFRALESKGVEMWMNCAWREGKCSIITKMSKY